jgi:hypothetical protein
MTEEAAAQRRAAAAKAAAARKAGRDWRTVTVPAELAARIEAARAKGGDAAAWQVIERALLLI